MGVKAKIESTDRDKKVILIITALETRKDFLSWARATNICLAPKQGDAKVFIMFIVTAKAANPILALAAREIPKFMTL